MSNYINWINSKVKINFGNTGNFAALTVAPTNSYISVPVTSFDCKNVNEIACNLYSKRYCESMAFINGVSFSEYCPKTCNKCIPGTSVNTVPNQIKETCIDSTLSCSLWKNFCNNLLSYQQHPCKKTCKLC